MQGLETTPDDIWEDIHRGSTKNYREPTHILRFASSGICNNYRDALNFANSISMKTGETCYFSSNPSHGFVADVIGAGLNLLGVHTKEVEGQKRILNEIDQRYGSKLMIEYHAHSRGGVIADLALNGVSQEITDRMCVITYGSPKEIPRDRAFEVINVRSHNDGVGGINDMVYFFQCMAGRWDIRGKADREYLTPSTCVPFIDHGIMNECYQQRSAQVIQTNNLKCAD